MPNSIDFRADQIQTKQIIVTGSGAGTTKLLIYGIEAQDSPVNEGLINTTYFPQDGIGGDVFLYVSGAVGARGTGQRCISVFGGDLHVSGNLTIDGSGVGGSGVNYFENPVGTLVTSSGSFYVSGSLRTTHLSASSGAEITGSFVQGLACLASGQNSHAEGQYNTVSSDSSHAEGQMNTASGFCSHAEGQSSTASGVTSHVEGQSNAATGDNSHAEGQGTLAAGLSSHSEGLLSHAYGSGSHAGGFGTVASGSVDGIYPPAIVQTVFGKYNTRTNTDSLFVIGNGVGDEDAARHDILRVNSGSVEITGSFSVSGSTFNQFNGLRYYPKVLSSITPGYTASIGDYVVAVSCSAGGDGVALPASPEFGTSFIIKDIYGNAAANNIIINIDGAGKIDGSLTYTINSNFGSANFIYFGNNNWGRVQ